MATAEQKAHPHWPAPSFDAKDWAEAFVDLVKRKPEIATDEATMIGWFANALMRGWDEHARRYPPQPEADLVDEPCEECGTPTARIEPRLCDQHVNRQ